MAFGDDFLQVQIAKRQSWAAKGVKSGSGLPFSGIQSPDAPFAANSKKKKATKRRMAYAPNEAPPSPHAIALAYLASHPEVLKGNQEHYEQVRLFETVLREDPELYELMAAVPNGGLRANKTANDLNAEGLKRGYPDIIIDLPAGIYHGARIEMKSESGKLSAEQKQKLKSRSDRGYYCAVCYGCDEALEVIRRYRRLKAGEAMPARAQDQQWQEAA